MNDRARKIRRMAAEQDGICSECERPLPADLIAVQIDHIIPRCRGGPNAAWNLRLVHYACNRVKHTYLTAEAKALAEKYMVTLHEPPGRQPIKPVPPSELSPFLRELYASGPPACCRQPKRGW